MLWPVAACLTVCLFVARNAVAGQCSQDCDRTERDAQGCCRCDQACGRNERDASGCCRKVPPPNDEWTTIRLDARYNLSVLRSEVTVRQYRACATATKCELPRASNVDDPDLHWGAPKWERMPMNGVTWREAERYCSSRAGRLPTLAEARWLRGRSACEAPRPDAGCALAGRIGEWVRSEVPPLGQVMRVSGPELVPGDHASPTIGFRCVR